jgi:hypothetical protein
MSCVIKEIKEKYFDSVHYDICNVISFATVGLYLQKMNIKTAIWKIAKNVYDKDVLSKTFTLYIYYS